MVGVDAADTAKVVFCYKGVELVKPKIFFSLDKTNPVQRDRCHDRAFAAADGAIAASRIHDALWQFELQDHAATVTLQPMLGLNGNAANLSNFHMIARSKNQLVRSQAGLHIGPSVARLRAPLSWGVWVGGSARDALAQRARLSKG